MSELNINYDEQLVDLRAQPSLQEVPVREGVILRPMQNADAPGILRILEADPSIRDRVTVASRMHNTEDVQREVAAYQSDDSHIRYVIHEDGNCVGLVSLWRDTGFFGQEAKPYAYGFGYFLDPAARGKRLVTDSVQALMNTVQTNFRVESFMAFCEDNNVESIAVLQKLGFAPMEKIFPEPTEGWPERLYEKDVTNG